MKVIIMTTNKPVMIDGLPAQVILVGAVGGAWSVRSFPCGPASMDACLENVHAAIDDAHFASSSFDSSTMPWDEVVFFWIFDAEEAPIVPNVAPVLGYIEHDSSQSSVDRAVGCIRMRFCHCL